jgi:iron complex outermembrane receptor protein
VLSDFARFNDRNGSAAINREPSSGARSWKASSVVASIVAVMGTALAQAQSPPPSTLPPISVEAKTTTKSARRKAPPKAKVPASTVAAPAAAPVAAPETGTGPVRDYAATRTSSGTKTDTPLKEIPQSISVVGAEQMRDQGAQSLQEALRYTPGIVADGFGFDSRGDYSILRGIPTAYFLDGMRRTYGSYANTSGAEPYSLERVEVLRGPSSMLFGQSTSGGIISMISKRPQDVAHGEIGFDFGSYDFRQVRADFGGPLTDDGKWLYRIVALGREAGTQVDFVDNDRRFLMPALTYRPTRDTSITLLGTVLKDEGGSVQQFLPHAGTLYPNVDGARIPRRTFVGEPTDFNNTEQQSASLLIDHKFAPWLSIHHGSRYTHTENTYSTHYPAPLTSDLINIVNFAIGFPVYNPANAPFLDPNQQQIARVYLWRFTETDVFTSDTHVTGKFFTGPLAHKVTTGFDYTSYETGGSATPILVDNLLTTSIGGPQSVFNIYKPVYGQTPGYFAFPGFTFHTPGQIPVLKRNDETQTQVGIYVQDQIKFGNWTAVLGVRKDWLTITQTGRDDEEDAQVTGRAGLMYGFRSGLTPYVSYSQSFAMQPGNLVVDDPTNPFSIPHAAAPLEGEQIEAGFKFQPTGLPFILNAALYELKEKNRLVDDILSGWAQQGAEARMRGFEIEAMGRITQNIKLIGAYTFTDAEYTQHFNTYEIGTPVEGVPRHMASLWGIYSFNEGVLSGLSLGAGVRYVGESRDYGKLVTGNLDEVVTPSYTLIDAMIAYDTKHWRWQLTGQNLEDKYYLATCTARGDCGIGQGRTLITSLTFKY